MFITPRGLFEWKIFPLGLCNAPATFQCMMHETLADALDHFMTIYLDNILVFSFDLQQYLQYLCWVFQYLKDSKL